MDWVTSTVKPKEIEYQQLANGKAFVMLRKDISETTQTFNMGTEEVSQKVFIYHEKQFVTELSENEVVDRFEELYLTADIPQPKLEEVVSNLSDVVDDLMTRVDEMEDK